MGWQDAMSSTSVILAQIATDKKLPFLVLGAGRSTKLTIEKWERGMYAVNSVVHLDYYSVDLLGVSVGNLATRLRVSDSALCISANFECKCSIWCQGQRCKQQTCSYQDAWSPHWPELLAQNQLKPLFFLSEMLERISHVWRRAAI